MNKLIPTLIALSMATAFGAAGAQTTAPGTPGTTVTPGTPATGDTSPAPGTMPPSTMTPSAKKTRPQVKAEARDAARDPTAKRGEVSEPMGSKPENMKSTKSRKAVKDDAKTTMPMTTDDKARQSSKPATPGG